jgi:hypothetical protein
MGNQGRQEFQGGCRETKVPESPLHLFRDAMKILPPEVRRQVRTMSEVPWFMELVNHTLKKRLAEGDVSDPAIPVIREVSEVQQQFLSEILQEMREQKEILRKIAERGE